MNEHDPHQSPRQASAQDSSPAASPLLLGFSDSARAEIGGRLGEIGMRWQTRGVGLKLADGDPELTRLREEIERGDAIVVLGDQLEPRDAARWLARLLPSAPPRGSALVLAAGEQLELFEPFVAADAVFYLSRAMPTPSEIVELLRAATRRPQQQEKDSPAARLGPQVEDLLHELENQSESAPVAGRLGREIETLLPTDTAHIWFLDRDRDLLWRPAEWTSKEDVHQESAAAGLIGYVARTGRTVRVERLGEDPRFDPDADAASSSSSDSASDWRFIAAAVGDGAAGSSGGFSNGSSGRCLGVLVALRPPSDPAFDEADWASLEYLARRVQRVFEQVVERHQSEQNQQLISEQAATVFRREAIEHHARPDDLTGRVLEISPAWMHRAVWVLTAAVLAALVFAAITKVDETSGGPAVVIVEGESARVLSAMPARLRPLLDGGMSARVVLDGFGEIARTSLEPPDVILSAEQLRSQVDPRYHQALGLQDGFRDQAGPLILLEAPLDRATFEYQGRQLELHDGLPGRLEVVTASKGLLESLIPGNS